MGVTVKKCHMIMSGMTAGTLCVSVAAGNSDNELANVTLSGRLFQNCAAATGNARPPMVDSLNGGIRRRFDPAERSAGRPDTSATYGPTNCGSVVSLHAEPCMSEQPFCTVSVMEPATSGD